MARGLGDVLHFFIPEDEQRRARERLVAQGGARRPGPRWCFVAAPERPALCALAIDLTAALATSGSGATLLAPFGRTPVLPRASGVCWEMAGEGDAGLGTLARRLDSQPASRAVVLLVPPGSLRALLEQPAARALDGLLVPVDASARGVARTLGWLHAAGHAVERMRIGLLVIGAPSADRAAALGEQLERAARRELGLEVQVLGNLERDEASYRSLLHGRSVVELDSASRASSSLRALSDRLARWRETGAAVAAAS
jgi:hypothetical protein